MGDPLLRNSTLTLMVSSSNAAFITGATGHVDGDIPPSERYPSMFFADLIGGQLNVEITRSNSNASLRPC